MSTCAERLGRLAEAVALLERYRRERPDDATTAERLRRLRERQAMLARVEPSVAVLAEAAKRAYDDGDSPLALDLLLRAHRAQDEPLLLYNMARTYEHLGELAHAELFYRRFLATGLDSKLRATAEKRLSAIAAVRNPPPSPAPPSASVPAPASAPAPATAASRPLRTPLALSAISVGALAVASLASAGAVYGDVASRYARLSDSCGHSCAPSRWHGLQSEAYADYALWAVGGAAAAVDVVLWSLVARRRSSERLRVSFDGRSLLVGGRF
jgi:hypothetical protein